MNKLLGSAAVLAAIATISACSGSSGSKGGGFVAPTAQPSSPATGATTTPTTGPTTSSQQVVTLAIPTSAIGRETDPTFGAVAGFTQNQFSQVLGFAPGAQIVIRNGQTSIPHTLGDLGSASFPASQPASLSTTGTGTTTLSAGWQSGTIAPGASIGPITLSAGTYFIGCAYHYQSDGMRDVLVVAAGATPGPQATQAPGAPTPVPSTTPGGGYGY